jgi:hypothetical protein
MKTKKLLAFIFTCLLISSCEERVDFPLSATDTNLIAVEGVISNEKMNHQIRLTRPIKKQNEIPTPVTGADVRLLEEGVVHQLIESPPGLGLYVTPEMRAVSGKVYTLYIQYAGKEYFASDSSVPAEPLRPLSYKKVNEQFTLVENNSGQDANYVKHNISWKNTQSCIAGSSCEGEIIFYDLKTIDVNEIYKPSKTDFFFPANSTVIRQKFSVSPAYKTYLRAMLSETEWRGGVFDVQREQVPTNLTEGAVGFFAVSTVVSDTTVVK